MILMKRNISCSMPIAEPAKIEAQHVKGKLHALERLALLFDPGTMENLLPGEDIDGVFSCRGLVNGKRCVAVSQDFTYKGGTLGKKHGANIVKAMKVAEKTRCPIVFINDSGGARVQEGIDALGGYGDIFFQQVRLSGVIPQIAVIVGPCAGGASYMPALADFVFSVENVGRMFLTGPNVVQSVIGQKVDMETLGGSAMHASTSGVVHFKAKDEEACFSEVRRLISILPESNRSHDSYLQYDRHALRTNLKQFNLPESRRKPFPIRDIIEAILDEDSFVEVHHDFAPQIIVGFARISGIRVGLIANNTAFMAGSLECDSSDKAARFVRFCDSMRIPIVTLTDVPGFMPGVDQEKKGVIRHGAKMIYAFSEARVPKINIILRNAYGGAYIAMNSVHLGADIVLAWENANIAVMGEENAVKLLNRKEIDALPEEQHAAFIGATAERYREEISHCRIAKEKHFIKDIINPENTRDILIRSLLSLKKKSPRSSHGNIPL